MLKIRFSLFSREGIERFFSLNGADPIRTANLTPLALVFDAPVQIGSAYQRLKRFFRSHVIRN